MSDGERAHPLPVIPPPRLPSKLEAILPLPLSDDTFPVRVAVRFRGVLTGLDLAAATFVDGWLHVEGRRANFAVRAGEGRAEWLGGNTLRIELLDGQSVALRLCDGFEKLTPYFRHAATLWIADREHPEGESILPPLTAHPNLRAAWSMMILCALAVPGLALMIDTLLGHRIGFVGTFAIWTVGMAVGVRLAFMGGRLEEADRRAKALRGKARRGNAPQ